MSGTSGAGDNHLQSSFACGSYILESSMGRTVRAIHPNLIWNFELLQDLRGFLHDRKIRVAAHDNADERFHLCFASPFFPMSFRYSFPSNFISCATKYARSKASASVLPRAVTLSTRPPAVYTFPSSQRVPA